MTKCEAGNPDSKCPVCSSDADECEVVVIEMENGMPKDANTETGTGDEVDGMGWYLEQFGRPPIHSYWLYLDGDFRFLIQGDCEIDVSHHQGTIIDGTFTELLTMYTNAVLKDGIFQKVTVLDGAIIQGGTFNGSVQNQGTIQGGTFNDFVQNFGTITGGTFYRMVNNDENGKITGGTFYGGITGTLPDGYYNVTIENTANCTVTASPKTVKAGEEVTLNVTKEPVGTEPIFVTLNSEVLSDDSAGKYKFTMSNEGAVIRAHVGDHIYQWEADETSHWKECTVCKVKEEDSTAEHQLSDWLSNNGGHWKKCETCPYESGKTAHTGGTATCTEKAVCTFCNQSYGDYGSHTSGDLIPEKPATETETGMKAYHKCNVCGKLLKDGVEVTEADLIIPKLPSTGGGIYISPVQRPTISQGEGYTAQLSDRGKSLVITVLEDYELVAVTVNGADKGAVTSLSGLKTGDTVEITVISKVEKIKEQLAKVNKENFASRSELAKTKKGRKAIRIFFKNTSGVDFDGIEVFRSAKKNSGYGTEAFFTTKTEQYYNTAIKKGNRYFYKSRGYIEYKGIKYYSGWSAKAWRTAR